MNKFLFAQKVDDNTAVFVYFEDSTLQITNTFSPANTQTDYSIYDPGEILLSYCSDTTGVSVTTIADAPYAKVTLTQDAIACGYSAGGGSSQTPPGQPPIIIENLAVNPESRYNAKDGSAVVTLSETGLFTSIDGVNYFKDRVVYLPIAPGAYVLYVTDNTGRLTTKEFTIAAAVAVYGCTIPYAINYDPSADLDNGSCVYFTPTPQEPTPPPEIPTLLPEDHRLNLYQDPDLFRIGINGVWTYIDMPIGWDKVEFSITRDDTYHGLNYEYNDGEIELGFDLAAGFELIEGQYKLLGNDAQVQFQFGRDILGLFIADVDAWVDFNTRKIDRDKITCSVKRKTFNDDIETKSEVIVTLADGYLELPLHSKLIRKQSILNTGNQTGSDTVLGADKINTNQTASGGFEFRQQVYGFIDFTKATAGDLSSGAPGFGLQTGSPLFNKQYVFKTDGGGPFSFNIDLRVRMGTHMNQPSVAYETPRQRNWEYNWYLGIVSGGVANVYKFDGGLSGSINNSRSNDVTTTFKLNKSVTLLQDDEVYIYSLYSFGASGSYNTLNAQQDFIYVNLNITGDTLARPTVAPAKLVYEVGQGILDDITSGAAKLKSNLLGRVDNGYKTDGCASLMAYTGGYLVRGFGYDKRPMQITLKDWIAGLNAVYAIGLSYELNADGTYCVRLEQQSFFYADVLISVFSGVADYSENIDVKRIYNELDFGYDKYPTDDVSTLDEFNTRHTMLTPIQSFKSKFTQISPQCAAGDAIELTRRVQFSTTSQDSYKYDEVNFIIAVLRDGTGFRPEKAENYAVSGVVGADTVYNLRYTISRNIDRWGAWLNSAWAYKKPAAIIENKYVAKNGDLTSQYIGDNPCESTLPYTEAGDLHVNDLQDGAKLFYPENITFKARVNWQTLSMLRRCHTGSDSSGRNYGYMGVNDPDGNTQYGYLKTLTYNPVSELTTFVLYKKYIPLGTPFDCSEYSDYTFADFESATGLPLEIEQCRFNNFA